jgi:hypothetical protein
MFAPFNLTCVTRCREYSGEMIELNAMHFPNAVSLLCLLAFFTTISTANAQAEPFEPVVISPRAGEAVQGRVEISGVTETEGFQRAEIEFRYTNDPKETWFLIAETDQPVNPGKITEWDTSVVTDGVYDLRVTVFIKGGASPSKIIRGIRVRNYSPIESPTPSEPGLTRESVSTLATIVPTRTPRPTQPVFPANPAVLTQSDLNSSLMRGGIAGVGFFLAFAIYWIVKKSLS